MHIAKEPYIIMKNTSVLKKLAALVIVAAVALTASLTAYATETKTYDASFKLEFASSTVKKGGQAGLKLDIVSSTVQISEFSLTLEYDSAVLSYNSLTTKLPSDDYKTEPSSGELKVSFKASDSSKNINGGTGFQLMFDVSNSAPASSTTVKIKSSPAPVLKYSGTDITKDLTYDQAALPSAMTTVSDAAQGEGEAKLSNIRVGIGSIDNGVSLSPAFSPDVLEYTATIPFNTTPVLEAVPAPGAHCDRPTQVNGTDSDDFAVKFDYKVTNADGTKSVHYIVKIIAAQSGAFSTTAPTESTGTTAAAETTETTTTTAAPVIQPSDNGGNSSGERSIELGMWSLIGILGGEIALFLLAFFAGFKSRENSEKAQELIKAQIEAQNPQKNTPMMVMPVPMNMLGQPEQMAALGQPDMQGEQAEQPYAADPMMQQLGEEEQEQAKREQVLQNQLRRRQMEMGIPSMEDAAIEQIPMDDMGMPMDNMGMPGMSMQGMPGMSMQGMPMQGMPGMSMQGMPMDNMGMPMQGMSMQYDPYGNLISYDQNGQQLQYDQFGNQL